jgi:uncharacterized protein (DUF58 family)
VIFTRRFLLLVAFGMAPLALSGLLPELAFVAVAWNALLATLALGDFLRTPRPEQAVEVWRLTDEALSVAADNEIVLRIRNATPGSLRATVRDEPPPEFAVTRGARQAGVALGPFAVHELRYTVVPPARGDFRFGDVYVRLAGALGLIVRQGRIPAAAGVSVFPNLRAVGDYDLLTRRAHLVRQGVRRTRVVGGGREFAALREYSPDDEYRTIDWKATARRGKVISRTYENERSQDILLVIDQGRLMRQRSPTPRS